MNKQKPNGQVDWLVRTLPDGTIDYGYTINPVSGCLHGCQWKMNGKVAICYAKNMTEKFGGKFEKVTFHPERLKEPALVKEPTSIFIDSNSDLLGASVTIEQVNLVLKMCADNPIHRFFLLTKNPGRLAKFSYPKNVWVGVSSPPDIMNGNELSDEQKGRYMKTAMEVLEGINFVGKNITWMSFEPLSSDLYTWVEKYPTALSWAVIGAGSLGREKVQPSKVHLNNLLSALMKNGTPVFMKSNLYARQFRQEFPQ